MTTIQTREIIREAADNCGDQLDAWRDLHCRDHSKLHRGIRWGLVLSVIFWGALFALYTYAKSAGAW